TAPRRSSSRGTSCWRASSTRAAHSSRRVDRDIDSGEEASVLVNPKEYLVRARREGWALGGFNVYNLESARAVIEAGAETAAPLLGQVSGGAVKHAGLENMAAIVRPLAGRTKAPVGVHLDPRQSQ